MFYFFEALQQKSCLANFTRAIKGRDTAAAQMLKYNQKP